MPKKKTMKLNFNAIKLEFFKYIEEKESDSEHSGVQNPINFKTSIFQYSGEWNSFLSKNKSKLDMPDNFAGSISDLLSMYDEGNQTFKAENKDNSEKNFFNSFLTDLMKNDKVKSQVDADGNSKISREEAAAFLEKLDSFDNEDGKLSLKDLFSGYDAIQNGTFSVDMLSETPEPDVPASTPSAGGDNGGGGGVSPTPSADTKDVQSKDQKDLTKLSVDELNTEKTTAQKDRQTALDKYQGVLNGSDEEMKKLYDESVKPAYEKFKEELTKADEETAKKYDEAKTNLDKKQQEVDSKAGEITKKDYELKDAESQVRTCESNVTAMEESVSSLQQALSSAKDEQKSSIQTQLDSAKAALETAKKAKTEAETKRDAIKTEKEQLEAEKQQLETEIPALKEEKEKWQAKVNELSENSPELKNAKDSYEKAETAYETKKSEYAAEVKSVVDKAQVYVDKINEQISVTQKKEITDKYSVNGSDTKINPELTTQKVNLGNLQGVMSYPKDMKEGEELPVLVFFTGDRQHGENYSELGMYHDGTTPLGSMFDPNGSWQGGSRVLNPQYKWNLSSFPGIILELNTPKNINLAQNKNTVTEIQNFLNSIDSQGLNGTKIKRGKTVVSGASSGTGAAYNVAMNLGSKYLDELIVISENPKNIKIDGVDIYGYAAFDGEKTYGGNMQKYIGQDKTILVKGMYDAKGNYIKSNHSNNVKFMFNADEDNNGYSDFFERHFGQYYHP